MSGKPPLELVQVGCYLRQDQAEERGLVALALVGAYWVIEDEGLHCLYVDAHDSETVTLELEIFEAERDAERELARQSLEQTLAPGTQPSPSSFSLYLFAWVMCLFFAIQWHEGPRWIDLGAANSNAILNGAWWRTFTALTLHADMGHLFANLASGLIFAWALLPLLGSGWTWLGILLSGAAGNALNAMIHRGGSHLSIGASTAVFGGLGLLVGWQIVAAIQRHHGHREQPLRMREIVLPFAAGLALFAYLGMGNGADNVDILAHALGMFSGSIMGVVLAWTRLPERTSPGFQKLFAIAALVLCALAWMVAVR